MLRLASKSLTAQPAGLFGSVTCIAGAFILVIFFDAVWRGESERIVAYLRDTEADVWVMQRGVHNMHMATSFVWDWKADVIAGMPGVRRVTPIVYLSGVVDMKGRQSFSYIVGFDPEDARAGPRELAAGRTLEGTGETVIPDVLARLTGTEIGDTVTVRNETFTVVGLSRGTYSLANAITFVHMDDLKDILSATGTYSYLMVDAEEGVDPRALAARIKQEVEKVNALAREDFIRNDFGLAMQMGVQLISIMTAISAALAALIVGFTAYSLVARRRRELAVVKAVGVGNRALIGGVVFQALTVTLLGFLLATITAFTIVPLVPLVAPQLTLMISIANIANVGLAALPVALAGALLPAHLVSRVDPASAFQG
jgi:putative ABC transport system permease protein